MGISRLLFRYELIFRFCFILIIPFISSGCKENMVKYDYFIEKPTAIKNADSIEIYLGYTRASSNWIKASYKIEGNIIYVFGELTFKEIPQTLSIKLPDAQKKYRLFWVDDDGKKTEIMIRET